MYALVCKKRLSQVGKTADIPIWCARRMPVVFRDVFPIKQVTVKHAQDRALFDRNNIT